MNENTIDRRVRKTKKLLRQGLAELLKQKPVNAITVREISDLVDINRGTFYLHYRDIFDMVEQIENEMLEEIKIVLDVKTEKGNPLPVLTSMFSYLADNAAISTALLGPNGDIGFVDRIQELSRQKWLNDWMSQHRNMKYFEYYFEFSVSGYAGIFKAWLQSGMKESPEEMAALARKIIQTGSGILE